MTTAIFCSSVLALLLFGLGLAVSLTRTAKAQMIGSPADPASGLHKVVRAHGNTAEYVPVFIALFLFLGTREPQNWVVYTMMAATVARVLIVLGILLSPQLDRPQPLRFVGALGTYITGFMMTCALYAQL